MKIKIEVVKREEKEIEITLPYYYEYNMSSEYGVYDIYGKITINKAYSLGLHKYYNGKESAEIKIEKHSGFKGLYKYLKPTNPDIGEISEEKYNKYKAIAQDLLGEC